MLLKLSSVSLMALAIFFMSMISSSDFDYEKAWKEVGEFQEKGLPASALEVVEKIYQAAKKEQRSDQWIKSSIFKANLSFELEDVQSTEKIRQIEEEISNCEIPEVRAVLHHLLAVYYQQYARNNLYRLSERTNTLDESSKSIEEWSVEKLQSESLFNLESSLAIDGLSEIQLEEIPAILDGSSLQQMDLEEFLLVNAIRYFSNSGHQIKPNGLPEFIKSDHAFLDTDSFLDLALPVSESNTHKAQYYYKILHQKIAAKERQSVLVKYMRWAFDYNKSNDPEKTQKYNAVLRSTYLSAKGYDKELAGLQLVKSLVTSQEDIGPQKKPYVEAMSIIEELSKNGQDKELVSKLKRYKDQIEISNLRIKTEAVLLPKQEFEARVNFRNVEKLHFEIMPYESAAWSRDRKYDEALRKELKTLNVQNSWTEDVSDIQDYEEHTANVIVPALTTGAYILVVSEKGMANTRKDELFAVSYFQVSKLALFSYNSIDGQHLVAVDRATGEPLQNVSVNLYAGNYDRVKRKQIFDKIDTHTTDANGLCKLGIDAKARNILIELTTENDRFIVNEHFYLQAYQDNRNRSRSMAYFMTDRSIYRPGQRVFYKGVIYTLANQRPQLQTNATYEIVCYNQNREIVYSKEVTSDAYGSVQGDFIVPEGDLLGNYQIQIQGTQTQLNSGSYHFKVEEYKRPTIKHAFDTIKRDYVIGDAITFSGKVSSMTDFPVEGADLKYAIYRSNTIQSPYWEFRGYPQRQQPFIVDQGIVGTDGEGRYQIDFEDPVKEGENLTSVFYEVRLTVSDRTGESLEANKGISLTNKPFKIEDNLAQEYVKGGPLEITFKTTNIEGQAIDATVKSTLVQLSPPKPNYSQRYWSNEVDYYFYERSEFERRLPNVIYNEDDVNPSKWPRNNNFSSVEYNGHQFTLGDLSSGFYQLSTVATNAKGDVQEQTRYFQFTDTHLQGSSLLQLIASDKVSSLSDVIDYKVLAKSGVNHILLQKWKGGKLVRSDWKRASEVAEEIEKVSIDEVGGFSISALTVLDNKVGRVDRYFPVEFPEEQFSIKALEIDEKVEPGKPYSWNFAIEGDIKATTEVIVNACLYDASLDEIYPHNWYHTFYNPTAHLQLLRPHGFMVGQNQNFNMSYPRGNTHYPLDRYPYFNWFSFMNDYYRGGVIMEQRGGIMKRQMMKEKGMMNEGEMAMDAAMPAAQVTAFSADENSAVIAKPKTPEIRKELGETVFFYNNINVDGKGNFDIDFTMNDGVSTYKLLIFAHSKELEYTFFTQSVVSRKEVIVSPNFPRILASGDKIKIPVKVENGSEKDITGTLRLEANAVLDGFANAVGIEEDELAIRIPAGTSRTSFFTLETNEDAISPLALTASFSSPGSTDAVRQVVPIISNQTLVRDSKPLWIKSGETKEIDLSKLGILSTSDLHKLSFEVAANPMHLVLQSMPSLHDEPLRYSAKLLDNIRILALLDKIITNEPLLADQLLLEAVENERSPLLRNEDLKVETLANTPWIRQAKDEEERKFLLSKYVDSNYRQQQLQAYMKSLSRFQHPSGGMLWSKEGRPSLSVSLLFAEKIARLSSLGTIAKFENYIDLENLMRYIHEQVQKDKNYFLTTTKTVTPNMIRYAYVSSVLEKGSAFRSNKIYDHCISMAQKFWTQLDVYHQSMAGLTFLIVAKQETAQDIVASLKERAIRKEDQGIFWKETNHFYEYGNDILSVAYAMEFLNEMKVSSEWLDGLKQWIVANKRVNQWQQQANTAEVLYSFMKLDQTWMQKQSRVDIVFDKEAQNINRELNYQNFSWDKNSMKKVPKTITVTNSNPFPIFGLVQSQQFRPKSEVTKSEGNLPLHIGKELYVQKITDKEVSWIKWDGQEIRKGDRLRMKLHIVNDRRMQFVSIIDNRAAGIEPTESLSGYQYKDGVFFYQTIRDDGQHFFIETLPKGDFVLEYDVLVVHPGKYQQGFAEIQSYYAPEFGAHSEGAWINVLD